MRIARVLALCLLPSLGAAQPVQLVHRFTPSPANPNGPLVQVPDGSFYGVSATGIIRLTTAGQVTQVATFLDDTPVGGLVRASDGALYGASLRFGARGSIFRFDPVTGALRTVHEFQSLEGRDPVGGLVVVGGSLYGVTRSGPGSNQNGTIFHVVLATGQLVTDHAFPATPSTAAREPSSPLVLGPDGLLYGTADDPGPCAIYSFNPATSVVTVVHAFVPGEGRRPSALTLGADGSLYGSASAGGPSDVSTLFRYTPGAATFELLYAFGAFVDGSSPGPLVAGGDGHFYGVTSALFTATSTSNWTVFRLRAGTGGTFTYETLHTLDGDAAGTPQRSGLTLGADGLLYGTAGTGGPTLAGTDSQVVFGGASGPAGPGTIFRFDPAEGGPPSNPIAFTVLHAFPLLTTWDPSAPVLGADGLLYGLTSSGGSTNRGAIYRLNPATGAAAILGEIPGALTGRTSNTSLVQAGDGLLYGISQTFSPSPAERLIVRVTPAAGTATTVVNGFAPTEWAGSPSGALYGVGPIPISGFVRLDLATGQVAGLSSYFSNGLPTPVTVTSDGQVYAIRDVGGSGRRFSLLRLTQAGPFGFDEIGLASDILVVDRLVEGPAGATYLAAGYVNGWAIASVNRTTGALTRVCSIPLPANNVGSMSVGPDGAIYGFITAQSQRMFRCDPATGTLTTIALPPDIGRVAGPLVNVGGILYGAASGSHQGAGGVLFRLAPGGGSLPVLDSDADGLPNIWETAYRLDPFSGTGGSGPTDDPDGDGQTNAQELAAGSHPRGFATRLFAEGATGPFFGTRFDITSPGGSPATIRARFLTDTGAVVGTDLVVPSLSHIDFDPATLPGLAHATFSTIIESDRDVAVDRTMTWDPSRYGSHLETGIAAPSTTWYFAEGSTSGAFSLFYLLQNPQATAVTATVTYLRPFGAPPIVRTYTLPPNSRTTIGVDAETAELATTDVSAAIAASAPIVAERAMYLTRPGQTFAAGHESAGVTAPALEWFFAEGATGTFFDLFVLIANPGSTAAAVEIEYLGAGGTALRKTYTVAPQSRTTIWVDDEELPAGSGQKPLASGTVSTVVRSTNGVPLIVERTMWWPGPAVASNFWYEAHNSPGATDTATRWALGGAEIGGSDGADTFVLVANTTATAGRAVVSVLGGDSVVGSLTLDLPAKSRTTVSLATAFPAASILGRLGVIVESIGATPVPLVVERATYTSPRGAFWAAGGNALAAPLP